MIKDLLLLDIFGHLDSSLQSMNALSILLSLERIRTLNKQKNVMLVFNVYPDLLLENEPLFQNIHKTPWTESFMKEKGVSDPNTRISVSCRGEAVEWGAENLPHTWVCLKA